MKSQPPISAEQIRQAIEDAGSVTAAALFLQVPRRTLYRWMEHYGITVRRLARAA